MPSPGGWLVVWGCGGSRRCFPSGTREVPDGKTLPTIRRKEDLVGLTPPPQVMVIASSWEVTSVAVRVGSAVGDVGEASLGAGGSAGCHVVREVHDPVVGVLASAVRSSRSARGCVAFQVVVLILFQPWTSAFSDCCGEDGVA